MKIFFKEKLNMRHYTTENENLILTGILMEKNSLPSLRYTMAFISASPRQIFTARHCFKHIITSS